MRSADGKRRGVVESLRAEGVALFKQPFDIHAGHSAPLSVKGVK
jgi:hypothetical protein